MRMKYLIKCLMLPLVVASLCTACRSEAPTTQVADKTPARPRQVVKLSLTTDITFPTVDLKSGSSQPRVYDTGSFIQLIKSKMDKKLRVDFGQSDFKTKIYLRKLNDDGTPSTNPLDIFSIVIERSDWVDTKITESSGQLVLVGRRQDEQDGVDPPVPFVTDVYVNNTEEQYHPERHYDDDGNYLPKNLPRVGERWQAAAIICIGDQDETADIDSRPLALNQLIDLHDPANAPFTEDAIWLTHPRTECFVNKEWDGDPDNWNRIGNDAYVDIPYCADWTDVTVTGDATLSIKLHAKPIATILHYVLHSINDPTPQPEPEPEATAAALPSAMRAVRGGHRQAFRGNASQEPNPYSNADNLSTDMGTFYGALYYDQHGNTVHWKRGQWLPNYHAADGVQDYNRIPAQFRRGLDVKALLPHVFKDTDLYPWVHIFYCLMPPYEGQSAGTHPPKFWLTEKALKAENLQKAIDTKNYGMYDLPTPIYYLKRGNGGTWDTEYQSHITKLVPGQFHSVYLRVAKNSIPPE